MAIKDNSDALSNPWLKLYGLAWMLCFFIAGAIYYILHRIWPMYVQDFASIAGGFASLERDLR